MAKNIVELGKALQQYGWRVGENPAFGTGKVGKHSDKSYHYSGQAIDVTDWRPDVASAYERGPVKDWKTRTGELRWRAAQLKNTVPGLLEVLGPGDPGHDTHVHIAADKANLTPQQIEWMATGRWKTPEGKLMATMPGAEQLQQLQTTQQATEDPGKEQLTAYLQKNNELFSQLLKQQTEKEEEKEEEEEEKSKENVPMFPNPAQGFLNQAIASISQPTQYV